MGAQRKDAGARKHREISEVKIKIHTFDVCFLNEKIYLRVFLKIRLLFPQHLMVKTQIAKAKSGELCLPGKKIPVGASGHHPRLSLRLPGVPHACM